MELERSFWVEPKEPVSNNADMVNEIIIWAKAEQKSIEIISMDEEYPSLTIDGKKYIAKAEPPKTFMFKNGIAMGKAVLGYKNIYFYTV